MKDDIIEGGGWKKEPRILFRLKPFAILGMIIAAASIFVVFDYELSQPIDIGLFTVGIVLLILAPILFWKEKGIAVKSRKDEDFDPRNLYLK